MSLEKASVDTPARWPERTGGDVARTMECMVQVADAAEMEARREGQGSRGEQALGHLTEKRKKKRPGSLASHTDTSIDDQHQHQTWHRDCCSYLVLAEGQETASRSHSTGGMTLDWRQNREAPLSPPTYSTPLKALDAHFLASIAGGSSNVEPPRPPVNTRPTINKGTEAVMAATQHRDPATCGRVVHPLSCSHDASLPPHHAWSGAHQQADDDDDDDDLSA
ncbi:uncharacterized protein J3D65DRAFT_598745 [Phyllosticta citribraziliensis]|uniref:Uncharacterized protein n=1 Tax=Phyllosticta citribraziliensis TaxID=989973 RepID=A0ABR1M875_9PEZI